MIYSKEEIKERYNKLPLRLRDEIWNEENSQIIQQIAAENNLRMDQLSALADETGLVMLGITKPSDFIPNLAERMKVEREKAKKVGQQVNERIFTKVRGALRQIHEIKDPSGKPEKTEEEEWKLSRIIKPQPGILTDNTQKVSFQEEETPISKEPFQKQTEDLKKVAQALEQKPEIFKEPESEKGSIEPAPSSAKTVEGKPKNIFEERMKEEGFRSPPKVVEKTPFVLPSAAKETAGDKSTTDDKPIKPATDTAKSEYPKSSDPYREPV